MFDCKNYKSIAFTGTLIVFNDNTRIVFTREFENLCCTLNVP